MDPSFSPRPFSQGLAFVNEVQKSGWDEALKRFVMDDDEARQWWHWYKTEVCTPWVIHESVDGIQEIEGREGGAAEVGELPLVVWDLEEVAFAGRVYSLPGEGLYRFVELTQAVRNLIVAKTGNWLPVLQGLSALQVHGNRQDGTSVEELKQLLPTCSFLCITCGTIASLSANIFAELGFGTRSVGALTMADWNTYDNGHALFELFCPTAGKWVLADPDMGFLFRRGTSFLDAGEVWESLHHQRDLELVPLARKFVDPFFLSPSGFNWFLRFRWGWQDVAGKFDWYKRILQSVAISDGGKRVYVGNKERILSYMVADSVEVLPYAQWRERLYGEEGGQ